MNRRLKQAACVIMSIVLLLSFSLPCFAAGENKTLQPKSEEEIVAEISILSCIYFFPISGHTWLYVENLSDEPIKVGLYEVPVGQGVSVGCFAFTAYDGFGIYYNLEAYRENKNNNSDSHYSITMQVNAAQLEKFSNDLANYPNFWSFYFNCAFFAFSLWNSSAGTLLIPLVIPAISQLELIILGAKKGVKEMYYPATDQIFRQRGTGANARLEPIGNATLEH